MADYNRRGSLNTAGLEVEEFDAGEEVNNLESNENDN